MKNFFLKIINFILPPRCVSCGGCLEGEGDVCECCFNKITFISKPYCKKCGFPFEAAHAFDNIYCGVCAKNKKSVYRFSRSAIKYDDFSKNIVLSFKFMDKTENAAVLAKWMLNAGSDIFTEGVDLVVPIPLHYTRMLKRKYNQSAILAKIVGKLANVKVDYSSVVRNKKTKPQVEFSGRARVNNVKGAFEVKNANNIKGKKILLIDDVYTTGSTLKECAKVLKKAGAKSVDFLTASKVY